jgi:hypothetical protein
VAATRYNGLIHDFVLLNAIHRAATNVRCCCPTYSLAFWLLEVGLSRTMQRSLLARRPIVIDRELRAAGLTCPVIAFNQD